MQGKSARLIAGLLVTLAAAGCAGKNAVNMGPGDDRNVQGLKSDAIDLSGHDYHVGDVSGTSLTGAHLSLSQLGGRLTVVNFWGSWCPPCRAEAQGFAALAKSNATKGVRFLGIDERDSVDSAIAFEKTYKITFPSIFDRDATMLLAFPGAVPSTTPTTILIGQDGKILAKVPGPIEYTDLRALINHYLATESA